jgi:hypothetical protein
MTAPKKKAAPRNPTAGVAEKARGLLKDQGETVKITVQDLEAALAELGDTPDKIAGTLRAAGVSGYPEDCHHCPVAHWLTRKFDPEGGYSFSDWVESSVTGGEVAVEFFEQGSDSQTVSIPAPEAVSSFVGAFDAGKYPFLDDSESGGEDDGP